MSYTFIFFLLLLPSILLAQGADQDRPAPQLRYGSKMSPAAMKKLRHGTATYEKWDPSIKASQESELKKKLEAEQLAKIPIDLRNDPQPPAPDYYESTKSVDGIDSDSDGVRDDVEVWINENGKTVAIRTALKLYTKARMKAIIHSHDSKISNQAMKESINLSRCFFFLTTELIKGGKLQRQINGLIINNNERSIADNLVATEWAKINKAREAKPEFYTWGKYCPFEVENKADLEARIDWLAKQKKKKKKKK
ncbi:MAG: hypothetical protein HN509_16420 [Halobacteriovoraceae bacterium]|jgi:hypothetical protein|nr:hypothetical protein [Halobacteriovoraceae bacterium]MBT5093938.1 hypothetical protein [Halobacteriovoraceae bacterium]